MSGILRLESLTKGNTLKQGDKTPLKYKLFDADGDALNIAGKSAKVRLVYPDFLTIGYEKDGLTVAQDDTVTFTIDSVIHPRMYHVEIIVDDKFIFPSREDESKFTVDKSSLGTEANIIEVVGVDAVVRKAVDLINKDPSLIIDEDKLVGDIISNTGIGSIEEYHQQFNDVIKELSEDKDYHSLPEIAGARRGYDTLAESLGNLSVSMINKNLGKLDQTFMSDEFLQQIVGNTPINAIPADNSLTTSKYVDKSIPRAKLTDNYAQVGQMHPTQSGTDFNGLRNEGTYFRLGTDTVTNGPDWIASKDLLIEVRKYGNYSVQKVFDLTDLSRFSMRRVTGSTRTDWETFDNKMMPQHTVLNSGISLSTLVNKGNFLGTSTQTFTDLPPEMVGKSFMLEVTPHGYNNDFIIQKVTETTDVVHSYSRYVRNGREVGEWRKDYSFGSSGLPLLDKQGLAMGDSQTEDGRYTTSLESHTGATVSKVGFGGCRMAKVPPSHWRAPYNEMSMVALANTIATGDFTALDATAQNLKDNEGDDNTAQVNVLKSVDFSTLDFMTLFWGTNDYTSEVPLGEPDSTSETEFNGAINLTIERLLSAYPNIQLVFITPLWRSRMNSGDGMESDTSPNGIGIYLYEYVDAIIERAKAHKIPVLDTYRTSGVNQYNYETLLSDGLHMNELGHARFGGKVGGFLNQVVA